MFFRAFKIINKPRFVLRNRLFMPLLLSQLALGWCLFRLYDLQVPDHKVSVAIDTSAKASTKSAAPTVIPIQNKDDTVAQLASTADKRIGVSVGNLTIDTATVRNPQSGNSPPVVARLVATPDPTVTSTAIKLHNNQKKKNDEEVVIDRR